MRRPGEWQILSVVLAYVAFATIAAGLIFGIQAPTLVGVGILIAAATARMACRAIRVSSVRLADRVEESRRATADANARVRELELRLQLVETERRQAEAMLTHLQDAVAEATEANLSEPREPAPPKSLPAASADEKAAARDVLGDPTIAKLISDIRAGGLSETRVLEHQLDTPAGRRTFKITLSPVAPVGSSGNAAPAPVVLVHDVTREKEVTELRNDFVSMVSHEFRTPLASIKAYAEMLLDGEAGDAKTIHDFHDVIHGEANRLGRLIDNVLTLARLEAGLVKLELKSQDLNELVTEAIEIARTQAAPGNVRIESDIAAGPMHATFDRDTLFQALMNLVVNAVRHTSPGGRVHIRTGADAATGRLRVEVSDGGAGIPAADIPFVFDKFCRVEANGKVGSGTGLGLTLARHIVEVSHHGRIYCRSEMGKGSTFGFDLPAERNS